MMAKKKMGHLKPDLDDQRTKTSDYITLSTVLGRGWSKTMVKRLLGEPDKTAPNPRYRCAAPMRLYARSRVKQTERTPAFADLAAKRAKRSAAARKRAEGARQALLRRVESQIDEVDIPVFLVAELRSAAIKSYNLRLDDLGRHEARQAHEDSDPEFLRRITTNFVRHELTDYDCIIHEELAGKAGVDDAVEELHELINAKIWCQYPELKHGSYLSCGR